GMSLLNSKKRGDMLVSVGISIPTHLNDEQKQLFVKLKESFKKEEEKRQKDDGGFFKKIFN
ncbi:MAG: hypothetical protein N2Z60_09645, partial [Elusimicrobiales bacterium]|nr:hypothetical protein [Elusimicrobiales bacterium]